MNNGRILISSILAGIMISGATISYINAPTLISGAFIFSIGLLTILQFKLKLYTGVVSYAASLKDLMSLGIVVSGNVIGCCLMFLFPSEVAIDIVQQKLLTPYVILFVEAILCNILIYVAVEAYKNNHLIVVVFAVAAFIFAGFEHSIANICFFISARMFTLDVLINIIVVMLGNALGGILFHRLRKLVR